MGIGGSGNRGKTSDESGNRGKTSGESGNWGKTSGESGKNFRRIGESRNRGIGEKLQVPLLLRQFQNMPVKQIKHFMISCRIRLRN